MNNFLERVSGLPFTEDKEGNALFYPWGIWGSGYIVTSHEAKNNIRKIIKQDCLTAVAVFNIGNNFAWVVDCLLFSHACVPFVWVENWKNYRNHGEVVDETDFQGIDKEHCAKNAAFSDGGGYDF